MSHVPIDLEDLPRGRPLSAAGIFHLTSKTHTWESQLDHGVVSEKRESPTATGRRPWTKRRTSPHLRRARPGRRGRRAVGPNWAFVFAGKPLK